MIKNLRFVFAAYLIAPLLFCNSVIAQFDYGTGSEGAFTAPAGTSTLSGTHNYTSFILPVGDTIIAGGDAPLLIKCKGNVVINGLLMATGGNGGIGGDYNAGLGHGAGGTAGAGGGGGWGAAGGAGGTAQAYGPYPSDYGVNGVSFANLGGAGHGGNPYSAIGTQQGGTGGSYDSLGTASSENGGAAINSTLGSIYGDASLATTVTVNSITTDLLGGSGGGGGGGHDQGSNGAPALQGGDGGGGGGGAIKITAYNITLNAGALISVRGGNSNFQLGRWDAGGGGGSGGTIYLQFADSLAGASLNTTPTFASGTIDIAGGHGGHFGTGDYAIGGEGGQGRYLEQQDPNPPTFCTAPSLSPKANGGVSPANVCSGTVQLTSSPTLGSGCTGFSQYAWSNGTNYWNGLGFLSATAIFDSSYYNISSAITLNATYTVYSRCSADTTCDSSKSISIQVSGYVTPAISISTPQTTTICSGTVVTFQPNYSNGGPSPAFQWTKNNSPVGNAATYVDSTFNNGDSVYCTLTSDAGCLTKPTAKSNVLEMQVMPVLTPDISINTPQSTTICRGTVVNFKATFNNGGASPVFQWMKNNALVGSDSTYVDNTLNNNDTVYCILTSSGGCLSKPTDTSNMLVMQVVSVLNPLVSISTPQTDTICSGTHVTFDAGFSGGGATPIFQWFINSVNVGSDSTFTDSTFNNGDMVYCVLTSSASCVTKPTDTSNKVVMKVIPVFKPTIGINTPKTNICQGQAVLFTSSTNSDSSMYQWEVNGVSVSDSSSYTDNNVTNNDTVICILTSGATCANPATVASPPLIMTVGAVPSAGIITKAQDTVCIGSNGHLTLTGSTGTIDWQSSATPNNFTNAGANGVNYYPDVEQTTYYRVITTSGQCSDTSAAVMITGAPVPSLHFTDTVFGITVHFNASASTHTNVFSWNFGDGSTSDSINPSHTYAKVDSSYFVCLAGANNASCSSQICETVAISGVTGINNLTETDLYTVYPIPFSDYIIIGIAPSADQMPGIEVYNIEGQRVYSRNFSGIFTIGTLRIDLPSVPPGIYFLRIKSAGAENDFIKTLIKE